MNFSDVMQNLIIGIVGGIFSSIIVSVVFYILNEYEKELATAKKMTYELQYVVLFWSTKEQMKKNVTDSSQDNITNGIKNDKELNSKNLLIKNSKKHFLEAVNEFSEFESWRFKFEIKGLMDEVYEILIKGRYCREEWNDKILSEVGPKIKENLDKLEECEKHFARGFIKRIFSNRIIITMGIVLVALILIA